MMVDGPIPNSGSSPLIAEFRKGLSPAAILLLAQLQDSREWHEIVGRAFSMRIRPWAPGADLTQWAYDSGGIDALSKVAEMLTVNLSKE